jgi:DedD protein
MAEREPQESEVTLSTGKLLAIFLGLAVVCAVFFTMGYMLGRGGASPAGRTDVVNTVPTTGTPATKPSAGNKNSETAPPVCVAGSPNCPSISSTPSTSATNPTTTKPATQTSTTAQQTSAQSNTSSTTTKPTTPPVSSTPATKNPPAAGTYMVQVAAVSKQEDADILVAALRRKQYPVFIVANIPGDPLFHIQVGPFTDPKEAEAMRNRLVSEGYSAIVKK